MKVFPVVAKKTKKLNNCSEFPTGRQRNLLVRRSEVNLAILEGFQDSLRLQRDIILMEKETIRALCFKDLETVPLPVGKR